MSDLSNIDSEATPLTWGHLREMIKAFEIEAFGGSYKGSDFAVEVDQPKTYMEILQEQERRGYVPDPHVCDETCACRNCNGTKDLIYNMDGGFHICGYFNTCNIPESRRLRPHGSEPLDRTPEEIEFKLQQRCMNCAGLHIEECTESPFLSMTRGVKRMSQMIQRGPSEVRGDIVIIDTDGEELDISDLVADFQIGEIKVVFDDEDIEEMKAMIR